MRSLNVTHTIIVNDKELQAHQWFEAPLPKDGGEPVPPHTRDEDLLKNGVSELRPGEVSFFCDQTLVFDTTFALKGDNRKFVVIDSGHGRHIAKPY